MEEKIRGVKDLQRIISALKKSSLFTVINVIELIDEKTVKLVRIKAELLDGTLLYITELHTSDYQKYSYNWQKKNGELIIRWDNKPHWKNIKTYPHHKHENGEILSSYRVTVGDVIDVIRKK